MNSKDFLSIICGLSTGVFGLLTGALIFSNLNVTPLDAAKNLGHGKENLRVVVPSGEEAWIIGPGANEVFMYTDDEVLLWEPDND